MTSGNLRAARRLYEAFESQDARALVAGLAPGFRGIVSDGMPEGLGGSYDGTEAILRDCWARVFALVDVRPVPDEYLSAGAERVVVLGRYLGIARATNRPLSAAFAHVLRFRDGHLVTHEGHLRCCCSSRRSRTCRNLKRKGNRYGTHLTDAADILVPARQLGPGADTASCSIQRPPLWQPVRRCRTRRGPWCLASSEPAREENRDGSGVSYAPARECSE